MNQIAIREENNFEVILKDVETMKRMCSELMKTKHYNKIGEDGIFAIIQSSKSLGISPLEGLNGALYYVQGKVGMGSETMNALIRRKGHSITKDEKSNDTLCILHGKRFDTGDTWTVKFSVDDAKRAGLMKNMYDKYPSIMLYNRAMSMLARQLFPDVIHNAGYCREELEEVSSRKSFDELKAIPVSEERFIKSDYITSDEIGIISNLLSECDVVVQEGFLGFISRDPINAKDLESIPTNQYNRLVNILKKKIEIKKSMQKEEIINIDEKEEVSLMENVI